MGHKLSVAFYNLENLFDTIDDPFTDDDDFTPGGKKRWTPKKYQNKIRKLAFALSKIGVEETKSSPTIIGLSEVENHAVIQDLIQQEPLSNSGFGIVHYESLDERGIDNALIYKKDEFTPQYSEPIRLQFKNKDGSTDYTRDVLYVNGELHENKVHFFVVHLPSKRNGDINKPKRILIAEEIQRKIDTIRADEHEPNIIVMGDFNDQPTDVYLKKALQSKPLQNNLKPTDLHNPMQLIAESGKGSMRYKNEWFLFDQILFSKTFSNKNTPLNLSEVHIFDEPFLQDWDPKKEGAPFRTYLGKRYQNGYSDHFPVFAILSI